MSSGARRWLGVAALALGCLARGPSAAADGPSPRDRDRPTVAPRPALVVVIDPKLATEGGVRTADTATRLAGKGLAAIPPLIELDERQPSQRIFGVAGRAIRLALLDGPLASLETTFVHEVYGHGARAREQDLGASYSFKVPLPYRLLVSPGSDKFDATTEASPAVPGLRDRDLAISLGGLDANYLSAFWMTARMVQGDGQATPYDLLAYAQKLAYAETFFSPELERPGAIEGSDDVASYVTELQDRFNRYRPEDRASIAKRLRTAYLWTFTDPTLLYAVWGVAREWLARGRTDLALPLVRAGRARFYPSTRFALSPFGAEHYLDLFAARGSALADLYGRVGTSGLASYTGVGLKVLGLRPHPRVSLGGDVDVWSQPVLDLDARAYYERPQRIGVNAGAYATVSVWRGIGATMKLAYKTSGWMMGQPLGEGLYGYAGVAFSPP